jgi:SAM-dependent methyltransferase
VSTEINVDVGELRRVVSEMYSCVSDEPGSDFHFPTGRAWALDLGYDPELLERVPEGAAESFAGVGNPFSWGALAPGEVAVDLGSGAGTDALMAAQMVGPTGRVTGVDMTSAMVEKARTNAQAMGADHVEFVQSLVEALPIADESADVILSNGVIDLIPDKDAVFGEILRVLRPGGRIQIADVTLQNPVSASGRSDPGLWAQ